MLAWRQRRSLKSAGTMHDDRPAVAYSDGIEMVVADPVNLRSVRQGSQRLFVPSSPVTEDSARDQLSGTDKEDTGYFSRPFLNHSMVSLRTLRL